MAIFFSFFSMGWLNLFGQKSGFAAKVKSDLERVQKEADKDPDTFKDNIARLEADWGHRKAPVEKSVAHAVLASAYQKMKWTSITDYDEETRDDYDQKAAEHFGHVLDDMEALARAKSSVYAVLMEKGKDSDLFGHDMLSLMIDFLERHANFSAVRKVEIYAKAFEIYQREGNLNGYGLMKSRWLKARRGLERGQGQLDYKAYKEAFYQLVQELKKEEVGADLALEYEKEFLLRDDGILFLKWAVENVGSSRRKDNLKYVLESKLCPSVYMSSLYDVMADKPNNLRLHFWNCERASLTIRKYVGRKMTERGPGAVFLTGEVVDRREVVLAIDSVNAERKAKGLPVEGTATTSLNLPAGRYVYEAECFGHKTVDEVTITSLRVIATEKDAENYRLYVVDNETGRPVSGVKVQYRQDLPDMKERTEGWENRGIESEVLADADGMAEMNKKGYVRAVKSADDYTNWVYQSLNWRGGEGKRLQTLCRVMTDRSLYRPGQTVKGSLVLYYQQGDQLQMLPQTAVTLLVQDAKWKRLLKQELTTNEYGTATFEVTLPADCEVGALHLDVSAGKNEVASSSVRVEEYKRPTFEVTFDGDRVGHFGEVLNAEGTAMMFAGVPVQGALVRYTVEYASAQFKRWWWGINWNFMNEGVLTTDDEGKFRVPVTLTDEHLTSSYEVALFRVKATVTDLNGESHDAEWTVNASRVEFGLELTVDEVVDLGKNAAFKVRAYDVNHKEVSVKGRYSILKSSDVVKEGDFTSGDSILLPKDLTLGADYRLRVSARDSKDNEVLDYASFTPYNSALPLTEVGRWGRGEKRRADKPVQEGDFIYSPSNTFTEGGVVDIFFTTQETDAYIIYNVYNTKGLIDHQTGVTDGTMKHLRLQHRAEWGEGIQVDILYLRNGHFVSLSRKYELVRPNKKLTLDWATFRDKLQPGQQEQWTLTVSDKDGKRVGGAEMMAVLYDASLDRLYPHSWDFSLSFTRSVPHATCESSAYNRFPTFSLSGSLPSRDYYRRVFSIFNDYEHDRYLTLRRATRAKGGALMRSMSLQEESADMVMEDALQSNVRMSVAASPMAKESDASDGLGGPSVPQEDFDQATIRENFAETAFFLPCLVTDPKGNVDIQFTLPESLTEWKFMGFAHTKAVDYGLITATATARKDFMLRPNMPRFVRWGDHVVLASSVINQSEKALNGAVRMRLMDARTGEVVLTQEVPFTVEAGKTVGVEFPFDVKEEWQDLDCEIIAMSGRVSDGEKNPLPVLSTKKEMVETVPYYIIGNADGTEVAKKMDLSKLFNENSATATNRSLKVEYTDNPAWMCIEALRGIKNPAEDDAIDYAASLYANTRLLELMQTFPVLSKQENADDLMKRTTQAETKLAALQNGDGGWSWFKGMSSSYYTTLSVCGHLAKLDNPNDHVKKMLEEGMRYLDQYRLTDYQRMKKEKKKIHLYNIDTYYLYVSALMPDRVVDKEVQKMRQEYLKKIEGEVRDLTIQGVANMAYTFRAFGRVKVADRFVNFLKDYMVEKPGQGRFYATDAAYYSWMDYRIPTQVAAMKAIWQKNPHDAYLNDMQLWLISQKQVQKWDNPMNTIDVADFLLKVSPVETFHESKKPVLIVDGNELTEMDYGTINTERDELEGRQANLILEGNVLASVPAEEVNDGVQQLEVKKQTPSISWGAAYATYLEELDNLKLYATNELKIQRKLYVQAPGSDKWVDFDTNKPLKVGDRLKIRHIITADRDMDFVRVSAQHPACLEPTRSLSGYQWLGGRGCYLSLHDSHFDLFFDWFTRGTSTVDLEYSVVRAGTYQVGISTVECVYAKQFGGHTEGMKVNVKNAQ